MDRTTRLAAVLEVIEERRAVRAFAPELVRESDIKQLLQAAVRAPTAMHREPWAFVVIQDRALLHQLSDRVKADLRDHATVKHPAESSAFFELLARQDFNVFYDANTLVVVCAKAGTAFAQADCWLAAENLMLAAHAMGLGTCVVGAAIGTLNRMDVKGSLGLSQDLEVIAPILVGVPREEGAPTTRRPPEVLWRTTDRR